MSDTNFSYMEVSAKRKKRNQFISVLIIVAIVLLGVIVWGWIELQKSRNAERIKNALNSQIEPGFKESESTQEPFTDTAAVMVQDAPIAAPNPEASKPQAPATPPEPVAALPVKPGKSKKAADLPKEPEYTEPPSPSEPSLPNPVTVRPPKPSSATDEAPVKVAMHKPDPIPAMPKPVPAQSPAVTAKVYPPEDLPLPEKTEPTDEARQAVSASPTLPMTTSEATPVDASTSSTSFKSGMSAYRQQDYVNAIRSFSAVPTPASRKRGAQDRDEYVQANFLKGLSLLKVGHLSEAVSAFQNVLLYEKYYPLANMNLGICYVELKQYAKAHQAFEAVIRDQSFIESAAFDDVMQRTKYFWALAWTRLYKNATNPDKQIFYRQQAVLKWKDYEVWFSKNDKYKNENLKAENYLK
ncbi:MAG: tetratricopeptide repeat protein, partial [Fibrobacteria bacterium]